MKIDLGFKRHVKIGQVSTAASKTEENYTDLGRIFAFVTTKPLVTTIHSCTQSPKTVVTNLDHTTNQMNKQKENAQKLGI